MKRITFLMAFVMLFALASCGSGSQSETAATTDSTAVVTDSTMTDTISNDSVGIEFSMPDSM